MEEYVESELSGIFQVKLVTKNIVRGSRGTQFMHMRVKVGLYDEIFLSQVVKIFFPVFPFNI